jgi:hypothetical protein
MARSFLLTGSQNQLASGGRTNVIYHRYSCSRCDTRIRNVPGSNPRTIHLEHCQGYYECPIHRRGHHRPLNQTRIAITKKLRAD